MDDETRRLIWERGVMKTDHLPGSTYARLRGAGYTYAEIVQMMGQGETSMWVYEDVIRFLKSQGLLPPGIDVHMDSKGRERAWVDDDVVTGAVDGALQISALPATPAPALPEEAPKVDMDKAGYRSTGMPQPQTRHIPTRREKDLIRREEALHRRIDMQETEHSMRLSDLRQDVRFCVMVLILLAGALSAVSYISGLAGHLVASLFCLVVVVMHMVFRRRHGDD